MTIQAISIVTGANRGLGLEISSGLAKAGHRVLMLARDLQAAQAAVKSRPELQTDRVSVHQFDVSRPEEVPALVELVSSLVQPGWRVNLVNNAAILPKTYSEANFRAVINTNVLALVRLVAAFVPVLQRAEGGVIINMTSQMGNLARVPGRYRDYVLNAGSQHWTLDSLVSGKDPVPLYEKEIADGYNMYVVSKGLVDRITELQAERYGSDKVAIVAVCPGWCTTDMGGPTAPRTPTQGADTAVWLLSEPGNQRAINGKTLTDRHTFDWRAQ